MAKKHPVLNTLDKMEALLRREGWITGEEHRTKKMVRQDAFDHDTYLENLENPEMGAGYCMIGALKAVTKDATHRSCVATILEAHTGERTIEDFNDSEAENIDSILDVINAARDNFRIL